MIVMNDGVHTDRNHTGEYNGFPGCCHVSSD